MKGFIIKKSPNHKREMSLMKDWKLLDYFGHVIVISMDFNSKRFKDCKVELARVGLKEDDYTVFKAIDGSTMGDESKWSRVMSHDIQYNYCPPQFIEKRKRSQLGCFMSHYLAIKEAARLYKENPASSKYKSVLIIEDNTGFGKVTGPRTSNDTGYCELFHETMKELPDDWDMFYFMAGGGDRITVSPHINKLTYSWCLKCYAIHSKIYTSILDLLETALEKDFIEPVDNVIASIHSRCNAYVSNPSLIFRSASSSQVLGGPNKAPKPEEQAHFQC